MGNFEIIIELEGLSCFYKKIILGGGGVELLINPVLAFVI
jgi:hypothetical protein